MSVTTPRPAQPIPAAPAAAATAVRTAVHARRRAMGASLGGLPVMNLVTVEIGLALALAMLAVNTALLPVAGAVLFLALFVAFTRWHGRWFTEWCGLTLRYLTRSNTRVAHRGDPTAAEPAAESAAAGGSSVIGMEDPRVALLRVVAPDLVLTQGIDHDRRPVGMAWHQGAWTAVLLVEPAPALVAGVGEAANLPLGALAPCLENRGVLLDAIQVVWHCYPGSVALPPSSPALASYLEVLGPLPAAARRTTWVAVRLDPRRCTAAISERGGGVVGAHRALIGALSRVRSALEARDVPSRPLDVDDLLKANVSAAELTSVAGSAGPVRLRERWGGVTAGGVGHASYAVSKWPGRGTGHSLNALTGVRALSSTVAMTISPIGDSPSGDSPSGDSLNGHDGLVGLRGLVRVSARTPSELEQADRRLLAIANRISLTLTPLRGLQLTGLAATMPLGGAG